MNERIDTRYEALKAMADVLMSMGYTRHTDPAKIDEREVAQATGAMIARYAELSDWSSCFEFITEGNPTTDELLFKRLVNALTLGSNEMLGAVVETRARWFGQGFVQEALDMLPSANAIAHSEWVDRQIDERREQV